ncbi:unnamed protein product, partial [Closterium sp. Naga37s-1]
MPRRQSPRVLPAARAAVAEPLLAHPPAGRRVVHHRGDVRVARREEAGVVAPVAPGNDHLSSKGLMAAQQVLITGESAGGQAVVNLCDYIAAYLSFATVKCLSDGGFFIDTPDRKGRSFFREIAENATQLHQMFNPKCNQ